MNKDANTEPKHGDPKVRHNKRILFVDDEPMVLQGLQRAFHSMRGEWQMEFVADGASALARMAQNPFDVVVSDMCMPAMNGAELLNQVMKNFPKTVRLVLSGHLDKELVLKCVGSTHQYLSKPCDAETLKATILRASSVGALLQNDTLRKLLAQMDRLPSLPAIYLEMIEALQDANTTIEDATKIIARDIGMTAKILKLVNSAFFGLGREISSAEDAVAYLGLDTVRSLVLSINIFSQFDESVKIEGFSLDALMGHSLQTADAAKMVARKEDADQKVMDEAFLAGMLHDTGKLVLAANSPDQFSDAMHEAAQKHMPVTEAEEQIFGANHADVGGYLFSLWGLPAPVVEAVTLHHRPGQATQKSFNPLTAVHVANALIHEPSQDNQAIPESQIDESYLAELGLRSRLDGWRAAWQHSASAKAG